MSHHDYALLWSLVLGAIVAAATGVILWFEHRETRRDRFASRMEQLRWDMEGTAIILGHALAPALEQAAAAMEHFGRRAAPLIKGAQKEARRRGWIY